MFGQNERRNDNGKADNDFFCWMAVALLFLNAFESGLLVGRRVEKSAPPLRTVKNHHPNDV
jgi:hypothetical protein